MFRIRVDHFHEEVSIFIDIKIKDHIGVLSVNDLMYKDVKTLYC